MKLHEFSCEDCCKVFEEFIAGDGTQVRCPHCRSDRVRRVLSAVRARSSGASPEARGSGCSPGGAGFS